mmetsp:Transcript_10251/g.21126  ORF Transcript_10251/g.21126 Transcript_10251/m.21126 type:complete len:136 (+) Transcript_10251:376-783(+)
MPVKCCTDDKTKRNNKPWRSSNKAVFRKVPTHITLSKAFGAGLGYIPKKKPNDIKRRKIENQSSTVCDGLAAVLLLKQQNDRSTRLLFSNRSILWIGSDRRHICIVEHLSTIGLNSSQRVREEDAAIHFVQSPTV